MTAGITAAAPGVLARPLLEARLDGVFGRRLALVVAGAGYGKSTLVTQWTEDVVAAWYTASASDRRLSAVTGILRALRAQSVELPEEAVAKLAAGEDDVEGAEVLAAHVSDALDRSLAHDFVLVVDDAHELGASSLRLLEALCRQAPAGFHLVLLSREALDLRVDRLRAQGQVLELTAADLAFTPEEVSDLCGPALGDDGLAREIHSATGGWPAAVRLAIEALDAIPAAERRDALARLRRPGSTLLSFLAHEVFERQGPDVQGLIRTVAPLDVFSIELCEELGVPNAADAVSELVRRGLFLQERGESFRLHALVRELAQSAWPLTGEERRSVLTRAAGWLEREGRLPEALATLAAGSDHDEIARLLELHGSALVSSGGAHVVARLVADLPAEARTAAVEGLSGEALLMLGDFDGSIAAFERAAAGREELGPALAWRMGQAYHFRGDLSSALATYARAGPLGETADDALVLAWSAGARGLRDETDEALALFTRALELAERSGDDRALAAAHVAGSVLSFREGRDADRERSLDVALAAAQRCGDLVLLSRIRTNRGAALVARSSYRAALAELDEALALAELPGFSLYGRTLTNRANAHLRLGLLDEAGAQFASVVEFARRHGGSEAGLGYLGIGDVHRERGNVSLARTAYELALELFAESEAAAGVPSTLAGLARVLVDDSAESARTTAERGVALASDTWLPAGTLTAAGWVALALGDREHAAGIAPEAQRIALGTRDRYAFAEALELEVFAHEEPAAGRARLEEALALWRELECRVRIAECELALASLDSGAEARAAQDRAEAKLRSLGVRVSAGAPAGLLRQVASPPPAPVAVQVLGGFAVLREGVPVPLSDWQTKKPRELLKILVCRRGRAVPKELAMETLWPGEDPRKLPNRLSVALSTLRAVLDPQRRRGPEHFVAADRESISLVLANVLVDAEVFLHEAQRGLALRAAGQHEEAREWLAQAEAAYAGEALEGDPYSDWAVSLREEARTTYVTVAHALGDAASAAGEHELALRYYLRILGRDAYDESAHLGLVTAFERVGRRGEARRAYRAYVARMEEIGATPAGFPDA